MQRLLSVVEVDASWWLPPIDVFFIPRHHILLIIERVIILITKQYLVLLISHVLELILKHVHLPRQLLHQCHVLVFYQSTPAIHLFEVTLVLFYHGLGVAEPGKDVSTLSN